MLAGQLVEPQPRFGRSFAQRQVVAAGSLVHLPDGSDPGLQVLGQQLGTVVFAMRHFWPAGRDREPVAGDLHPPPLPALSE